MMRVIEDRLSINRREATVKLSLSMYSLVCGRSAPGSMDLMGFIDYAAGQDIAGVELLDMFWTDAEREIPQAVKAANRRGRPASCGLFHQ